MAWIFNTWAEWIDTTGKRWAVSVAAGAIVGAGTLYWFERPEPNYPAAQDEAVLIAATLERAMVAGGTDALVTFAFGTNGLVATNAVKYYPSLAIRDACAAAITNACLLKYGTTLTVPAPEYVGEVWVDGSPGGPGDDLEAFSDDKVSWEHFYSNTINAAWWTGKVCQTEWVYPFQTNQATIHPAVPSYNITSLTWCVDWPDAGTPCPWIGWEDIAGPHPHEIFDPFWCYFYTNVTVVPAVPESTNWHARVPYVSTIALNDMAKVLSSMRSYVTRGEAIRSTNYYKVGARCSDASYAAAVTAAWDSVISRTRIFTNVVTSYPLYSIPPGEGVHVTVFRPDYPDYVYKVTIKVTVADIVFAPLRPIISSTSTVSGQITMAADAYMPDVAGGIGIYLTNGLCNSAAGVPFRLGSFSGSPTNITFCRQASPMDSWDYASETFTLPPDEYYIHYGWNVRGSVTTYGPESPWREVVFITDHKFQYLTNAAAFWGGL